jgi:Zn-finger nucleic acid-binding protein
MQCPVCKDPQLVIAERQGIEIDYCPSCRGVWLDRRHQHYKKPKSWLTEIFD